MDNYRLVASVMLLSFFCVRCDWIYNDYAGPFTFVKNNIGVESCRIKGKLCANVTYHRRKIPNSDNWTYNVTVYNYIFMKETTTMRVVATTRGSSGRYQSLADITMPGCDWCEFGRPLVVEFLNHAGYKFNCLALIPGEFKISNFVLDHERYYRFTQIPIAPYGFYRVEFRVSEKDNPNCLCFRLYLKVVPDTKTIRQLQRNLTTHPYFYMIKEISKISPLQHNQTTQPYFHIMKNKQKED